MPPLQAEAGTVLDQPRAEREHGDADRQVDVEDPVPVDGLDERAAEQQAERAAGGDDEHVRAHRLHALVGAREVGDDEGDDHRGGDRAAETLEEAGGDQQSWLSATPQSAEAMVKRVTPERKTRLRPTRSPSRPAIRRKLP